MLAVDSTTIATNASERQPRPYEQIAQEILGREAETCPLARPSVQSASPAGRIATIAVITASHVSNDQRPADVSLYDTAAATVELRPRWTSDRAEEELNRV